MCRMKEEDTGEVPVAFVVRSKDSNISEDEIKQFVSKQVHLIRRFYFYEKLNKFDECWIVTLIVCMCV